MSPSPTGGIHAHSTRFHPIFLGGVNVGSGKFEDSSSAEFQTKLLMLYPGNKPPWTLPAKGAYSKFDSERACKYFGVPQIKTPDFFPILSILV